MLNILINIQNVFTSSAKRRCTGCKRRLDKAIDEQIVRGCPCDTNNCRFHREITEAISSSSHSKEPELLKWESNINTVLRGKTVTLTWDVKYAKKVFISGLGEVPIVGEKSVVINGSIRFTLQIFDFHNQEYLVEDTIDIIALEAPIVNLSNEVLKIEENNQAQITWQTENVTKVLLIDNNNRIDVSNTNHYFVNPITTCNYTLEFHALDNISIVSKNIIVEVFKTPVINFFKIDSDIVFTSKPVYLEWETEFAKNVEINFGIGKVAPSGKKRIFFEENAKLLIIAYGELSFVEETIEIFVFPKPLMESLLVKTPDFQKEINFPDYMFNFKTPEIIFNNFKIPNFGSQNTEFNLNETPKNIELEIPNYFLSQISKESSSQLNKIFIK